MTMAENQHQTAWRRRVEQCLDKWEARKRAVTLLRAFDIYEMEGSGDRWTLETARVALGPLPGVALEAFVEQANRAVDAWESLRGQAQTELKALGEMVAPAAARGRHPFRTKTGISEHITRELRHRVRDLLCPPTWPPEPPPLPPAVAGFLDRQARRHNAAVATARPLPTIDDPWLRDLADADTVIVAVNIADKL